MRLRPSIITSRHMVMAASIAPLLASAFFAPLARAADDDVKAEYTKLEGEWEVTDIYVAGMPLEGNQKKKAPERIIFKAGRFTLVAEGRVIEMTKDLRTEINPKATPKTIDLIRNEKEILPCIYDLNGDDFRLALPLIPAKRNPEEPLPRPESLGGKARQVIVLIAKRSKP